MSNEKTQPILPVIIFLVSVSAAFTYGETWMGIVVTAIGVVSLGWSKRHDDPFPTNKTKE